MATPSTALVNETEVAYDPAWDVAVQCLNDGQSDVQAIKTVWRSMPPPAPLPTLATIIGAIYADTYWATTRMDANILAASLQKAGGWNWNDCLKAAQIAFSQWRGLLARNNFGNSGQIPKPGDLTNSPDVLVNDSGALDPYDMLTKWNSRFYNAATGTKNYAYGRVQSVNIPVPIQQPLLRMFYTDAGFVPPPQSWQILYTFGQKDTAPLQGLASGPIPAGGRAANGAKDLDAFSFMPPGAGHYCLLTVAGTEFFSNNPTGGGGNWNSQEWITYNGAAGWHNLDVTRANQESLKFYNQDSRPERFAFEAHCFNLPAGTKVSIESRDARLTRPIDSGTLNITGDYHVLATEAELPPNFAGDLLLKFVTPGGKPLPAGAWIEARMLWIVNPGHPHYEQAVDQLSAYRAAKANQSVQLSMGSFSFVGEGK